MLELLWLDSTNTTVTSGNGVTLAGSSSTMDTTLTSTLTFTRLRTSQGGVYRCAVNMTIPDIVDNFVISSSAQVSVIGKCKVHIILCLSFVIFAVAASTSVTFAPSRESTLYMGISVNLTCSVTVDTDIVDTAVMATFSFPRTPVDPEGVISSDSVTGTGPTFTGVAEFAVLLPSDDGDQISCVSRLQPVENLPFVQAVDNPTAQYQLQIERKG